MYKMRKDNVSCCPMGHMHDGVVECYYYGVVTLKECSECSVRKDKNIVRKSG